MWEVSPKSCDICVCMWTYVDDCVCLDVVHVWVAETQLLAPPLGGADNTRGDGVLQGERATNGNHKLARAQVRRASEQQHWQLNLHRKGEQDKRESMGISSLIRGGTVWLTVLRSRWWRCSTESCDWLTLYNLAHWPTSTPDVTPRRQRVVVFVHLSVCVCVSWHICCQVLLFKNDRRFWQVWDHLVMNCKTDRCLCVWVCVCVLEQTNLERWAFYQDTTEMPTTHRDRCMCITNDEAKWKQTFDQCRVLTCWNILLMILLIKGLQR